MATAVTAGWGLLVVAVLVAVIASTTRRGSLPRNGAIGLRTPSTQHCDECWDVAHRAALPVLLVALLPLHRDAPDVVAGAVDGTGYVLVLGLTLWAALVADRAARRVHR